MKIKNIERAWNLETRRPKNDDCIEIIEHHIGCPDSHKPHVYIPLEAIDKIVMELLKAKEEILKDGYKV